MTSIQLRKFVLAEQEDFTSEKVNLFPRLRKNISLRSIQKKLQWKEVVPIESMLYTTLPTLYIYPSDVGCWFYASPSNRKTFFTLQQKELGTTVKKLKGPCDDNKKNVKSFLIISAVVCLSL